MAAQHFWIYQSAQKLSEDQASGLQRGMQDILHGWKYHGTPVDGRFEIRHGHFLLVEAVAGNVGGCSIDNMNSLIMNMMRANSIEVLEQAWVPYRSEANIRFVRFNELESAIQDGRIGPETIVFDHSQHPFQQEGHWETQARNTWISRYFQPA